MQYSHGQAQEPAELGYAGWFGFWGQLVVLALLAVVGAFFASADNEPGDYTCGLLLFIAAVALAFLRLKAQFDGGPRRWGDFLLVDNFAAFVAVVVVFGILALIGLFVAASFGHGGLYDAGIALFVASFIVVFLSLRRVWDNLDRRH